MNGQENRDRLARAVKAARLRKYKTVDRARIAAGVSRGTWDNVERGDSVKAFSLAAIEEALEWPEGKALAILTGEDPTSDDTGRGRGYLAELIDRYMSTHPQVTDSAIAGIIGVSTADVTRWRTNKVSKIPPAEHLRRLAELLGVSEDVTFRAAGIDAGYLAEPVEPPSGTPISSAESA